MINHCNDDRVLRRARLLIPALLALALAGFAQKPELMPTVKVRPPSATTPDQTTDCTTALVPAPPRVVVEPARPAEMPRAVERATTASRDTGGLFRRVQEAAEADDRVAFKAALQSAHAAARNLDPGTQRTRADGLLKVYDDIERVWDYAFASPTGAFFSAASQGGTLLPALARYPGYNEFIMRQSFVDQTSERYYPTRESRAFLTSQASRMLSGARLGEGSAPSPVSRGDRSRASAENSSASSPRGRDVSTGTGRAEARRTTPAPRRTTTGRAPVTPRPRSSRGGSTSSPGQTNTSGRRGGASGDSHSSEAHSSSHIPPSGHRHESRAVSGGTSVPGSVPPPVVSSARKRSATPSQTRTQTASELNRVTSTGAGATTSRGTSSATTPPVTTRQATTTAPATMPASTTSAASATSGSSTAADGTAANGTAANLSSTSGTSAGTTATTSSASSSTTAETETTAGAGTPTQPFSEPKVPAGGKTYLSFLMVAIGLIVLIVLIRASK